MADNDDPVARLIGEAPELINTPGLAADAIASGAPAVTGPVLAHAQNLADTKDFAEQHDPGGNFLNKAFSHFGHTLKHAGSVSLEALAAPLQDVQHQYRFLSDVSERHGMLASSLIRAAMITTGAAGSVLGGPEAGILAAEGVGSLIGRSGLYRDSWEATADGENYRDKHGNKVNPGFDLANIVDNVIHGHDYEPNSGVDIPTGIINAVFDLSLDPVAFAAKAGQAANLKGVRVAGKDLVTGRSIDARNVDDVARMQARPSVLNASMPADRAVEAYRDRAGVRQMVDILSKSSTEDILNKFPKLRPLAKELGAASSHDDVLNVFRDALTAKNYSVLAQGLPTTGITRRAYPIASKRGAVLNARSKPALDETGKPIVSSVTGQEIENPNRMVRSFTTYRAFHVDDELEKLSSKEFNLGDSNAGETLYSILKMSQNARTSNAIVAKFLEADTISERVTIYANALTDMLRASGLEDAHPFVQRWRGDIAQMMDQTQRAVYGVSKDGKNLVYDMGNGEQMGVGLLINQQGKVAIPSFSELRKAQREAGDPNVFHKALDTIGKGDDWLYSHYTTKVFKSLALLSLGFAQRVAAAELIPATIRYGGGPVTRGILGSAAIKLNPSVLDVVAKDPQAFVGKTAEVAGTKGRIVWTNGQHATVDFGSHVSGHPVSDLTLFHDEISHAELRKFARDLGMGFDKRELPHIKAAVGKALYGVSAGLLDKDYVETAYLNVLHNDGHMVAPALATGHGEQRVVQGADATRRALKSLGRDMAPNQRMGSKFSLYGGQDPMHELYWRNAITEAIEDPALMAGAKAYADALDQGLSAVDARKLASYADRQAMLADPRYKKQMIGATFDIRKYADLRADLLEGLIHGSPTPGQYVLHRNVLDAMVKGEAPTLNELSAVPILDRPIVKGRVLEPFDAKDDGLLPKITNFGFRKLIDPVINHMSREPIFTTVTTQHYKQLKPFIEAGYMDKAAANWVAQQRAVADMLPLIHNTEFRSQFAELGRNYMPFYFAQEQAFKRYAKVIFRDPVTFERYRLAIHGVHSSGVIQADDTGEQHIVYPGGGLVAKWMVGGAGALGLGVVPGVPARVTGNVISLKSVGPGPLMGEAELPGASPLFAVSMKAVASVFPESEPFLNKAMGEISANQSWYEQMIPNATLKRFIQAVPPGDHTKSFQNAFMYTIANAARRSEELRGKAQAAGVDSPEGKRLLAEANKLLPGPDGTGTERQIAMDRLRNTTRVMFLWRAVFGAVAPMAPNMQVGDYLLRDEVAAEIKKAGDPGVGIQNFLEKHPDATPSTVFLSDNKEVGTNVPSGPAALEWIRDNRGFVQNHQYAAAYLLPQDGKRDMEAYNLELATNLRQRRTPESFTNAIYAAATNAKFYAALDQKNELAKQFKANGDTANAQALRQQWSLYVQQLAVQNPIWYAELNSPTKQLTAHQALTDIREVLDSGKVPDSPQAGLIAQLVNDYDNFARTEAQIRATGQAGIGDLNEAWDNYLTQFAKDNPLAAPVVNGVFRRLPQYDNALSAGLIDAPA